jgi:hypothetical protein
MPKNPERFRGLMTNVDEKDVPIGYSVEQVNLGNYRPGRLDCRKGMVNLGAVWGGGALGSTDLQSAFAYMAQHARWAIFENTGGTVYAARNGRSTDLSLITGLNAFQPVCCVQDPFQRLLVFNGIERGYLWKGADSTSAIQIGIDSPETIKGSSAAPTLTEGTGAAVHENDADYWVGYRYVDADGFASSMSDLTKEHTAASGDSQITVSGVTKSTDSRVTTIEFWITTANAPDILYLAGTADNSTWDNGASTFAMTKTDDDLLANPPDQILALYKADRFPNARRFTPPPTHKPFACLHQDRLWFYGRVFYNEGTVALNSGNTTATFTGSALRTEMAGWTLIVVDGDSTYTHVIASVNEGAGTATLTTNGGATVSGKSFMLTPNAVDEAYLAYYSEVGEPESVPVTNAVRVQSSPAENDYETGLMPLGTHVYLLHERHYYQMQYCCEPRLDASISPAYSRGCVNNRCWVIDDDNQAYLLDQLGVYRIAGGRPQDLSTPTLQNYFATTVDWSESSRKWYFASYEPSQRVVRFHVKHSGDSGTRPKRAICLNTLTGQWWHEAYPVELAGACIVQHSGRQRLVCASEDGVYLLMFEGYADLQTTATQGTITTAANNDTTFVDSAASFTSAMVGAPVSIIKGTGKGTTRFISANNSGTSNTVDSAWTTGTDSVYLIGAVNYRIKTGCYELAAPQGAAIEVARNLTMEHVPTSNAALATVRLYRNRRNSADVMRSTVRDASGVVKYLGNTADIEVDLRAARAATTFDPGKTMIPFDQAVAESGQVASDEYLQVEVEGYQGLEQITLTRLDGIGVA